jgi:nitronate monooxygenase
VAPAQRFKDRMRADLGLPPGPTELPSSSGDLDAVIAAVLEEGVSLLSFGLGDPGPWVDQAHAVGALVMAMVSTVAEAEQVAASGVDIVVAQGAEAGGHRSTFVIGPHGDAPLVGTLALVPQVVDAVDVPVVAAGGIADGRGVAAALSLGAQGALIGTRFLVARESGVPPHYRERLLAATEADTVVTRVFSGRPARSVRNRFVDAWDESGAEPLAYPDQNVAGGDIYRAAAASGQPDYMPLWAGQGLRLLKGGQRAEQIVDELAAEAVDAIARLRGMVG